mgnify:CR=1 FL=1
MKRFLLALLATGLFVLPASGQQPDYTVGAQDVLTVTVYDQPDLSGKFKVEADGAFTFPLVGRVPAAGQTLHTIEAELTKRLSDGYLKNPQVTVAVESYQSQRIFILGEVRAPGSYTLSGDMTLIEALSRAGSTTPAASDQILIVRPAPGKATGPTMPDLASDSTVLKINIRDLQEGDLTKNAALKDGDTAMFRHANEDVGAVTALQAELGGRISALRIRRPNLNDVFLWVNAGRS